MKLCIDCAYARRLPGGHIADCVRPTGVKQDFVSGPYTTYGVYSAQRERSSDTSLFGRQKCGPDARFFQVKGPPPDQETH